jgi:DNA-binding HxlR family transcriptional regulator
MQLPDAPHDQLCHARQILDRVGDKWSISVIHALGDGTRRFTELRNAIAGISQRMLTSTLRSLERDGLVERTVHPVVPPRVDYRLTPLGETLSETAGALMTWAVVHSTEIAEARAAYDHAGSAKEEELSAPAHRR